MGSWVEQAVATGCAGGSMMLMISADHLPGLAARAVTWGLSAQDLFCPELRELLLVEPSC